MPVKKTTNKCSTISPKRGNGKVRYEIWEDEHGKVTRYNLAYINSSIYAKDNGRVFGYDNAHGIHHRHYMGKTETIAYQGFGDVRARFNRDLESLLEEVK